jgi:hypothetical protein
MHLVERDQCLNFIFPFSLKISTMIIKMKKNLTIKCDNLLFLIFCITQNSGSMIIERVPKYLLLASFILLRTLLLAHYNVILE